MMRGGLLVYIVWAWMRTMEPSAPWADTYQETADAIVDACGGDIRCSAILTSIAFHESRFNQDPCTPRSDRCDRGQSVGAFQISRHWAPGDTVQEQARAAVRLVKESFSVCRARPLEERLGWYASGGSSCGRPASSRLRMATALALVR